MRILGFQVAELVEEFGQLDWDWASFMMSQGQRLGCALNVNRPPKCATESASKSLGGGEFQISPF